MISFQIRLMGATSLLLLKIMLNYSKQGWLRSVATHWLWSSTPTSYQVATKKSQIHRICRPPAQQSGARNHQMHHFYKTPSIRLCQKVQGFNMFQRLFHSQNQRKPGCETPQRPHRSLSPPTASPQTFWDILDPYPFSSWWVFHPTNQPIWKNGFIFPKKT